MRRSIRSLIVALLCLTLGVDSAKACWWLRHHRSRPQVCRPAACPPVASTRCDDSCVGVAVHVDVVAGEPCDCACGLTAEGQAAHVSEHASVEDGPHEHAAVNPAAPAGESVVVHGPTMVVDAAKPQPAASVPEPASVVAQPMPAAAAGPSVLPTTAAAEEPIPNLKPATAQSPVAPASNEQPMPEPRPKPAPDSTAAADKTEDAETEEEEMELSSPKPAAVDELVGGPAMKPPMPVQRTNLFDLYDDEHDEAVDAAEESTTDNDAGEPADASEGTDGDDAEMAEDGGEPEAEATDTEKPEADEPEAGTSDEAGEPAEEEAMEEEAADGDDAPADPDASADESEASDGKADESEEAPETAADPAESAVVVPNEPMRRWSDDSGTHHAQGWLVEMRGDRVRILKVNGRHATVRTESLSAADRDYVSAVGARLAAERQGTSPAPSATAGL